MLISIHGATVLVYSRAPQWFTVLVSHTHAHGPRSGSPRLARRRVGRRRLPAQLSLDLSPLALARLSILLVVRDFGCLRAADRHSSPRLRRLRFFCSRTSVISSRSRSRSRSRSQSRSSVISSRSRSSVDLCDSGFAECGVFVLRCGTVPAGAFVLRCGRETVTAGSSYFGLLARHFFFIHFFSSYSVHSSHYLSRGRGRGRRQVPVDSVEGRTSLSMG